MTQDDRPKRSRESVAHEVTADDDAFTLSAQLRAALRKDLAPDARQRASLRAGVWSAVATGQLPVSVSQVDAAMKARALHVKSGAAALGHAVSTKLIVSGLLLTAAASGATLATRHFVDRHHAPTKKMSAPARPDFAKQRPSTTTGAASLPADAAPTAPMDSASSPAEAAPPAVAAAAQPGPQGSQPLSAMASAQATAVSDSRPVAAQSPFAGSAKVASPRSALPETARRGNAMPSHSPAQRLPGAPARTGAGVPQARGAAAAVTSPQQDEGSAAAEVAHAAVPAQSAAVAPIPPGAGTLTQPSAAQDQASPVVATPMPPAPSARLGAELALVRAASSAIDHTDLAQAFALLSRYEAQYPQGVLRTEVQALRAVALCRSGKPGAASVSSAFLRQYGSSTLAERVRRACTGSK